MRRDIAVIFITFLCCASAASAQNANDIRRDGAYIYAEASGPNVAGADSLAIVGMVGKLAQTVDFPYPEPTSLNLMMTYSDDIKRESGMISSNGRRSASVIRYIRRDEVERIFSNRRSKINEMMSIASTADKKNQTDVALRYYTWAETLMRSLPSPDVVRIAEMRSRKEAILNGLKAEFDRQDIYNKGVVELTFTCGGKPVKNIDYRFYDGKAWSGVLSAKDGKGFVEVRPDSRIDQYRIKYEITPSHLRHLFREVSGVERAFSEAAKTQSGESRKPATEMKGGKDAEAPAIETESTERGIDFSAVKKKVLEVVARDEFQTSPDSSRGGIRPVLLTSGYERTVLDVCKSVSDGTEDRIQDLFTEEGYSTFTRLIRYGNAKVLNFDGLNFYALGDEVFCRSVPMVFSFNGNQRRFVENVVFTFDSEGKICDLSFSLDRETVRDIISQDSWTEEARIILISFLESYKTAYALKRLDYISSIFDDDALIITGRVLRNVKGPNEYLNNRYVTLTRQNKANYIRNLERVFASQEYINIQFSDCEVMKLGKGEQLFGIKIRQEYFSTTYSDTGYLFILVDLRDYTRPVIHVRTWQDEPDKNFGVIGPYNF